MKFENTNVYNIDNAILSMRNAKESHDKSDSYTDVSLNYDKGTITRFNLGVKDKDLAQCLIRAGREHRKFLRQIFVSVNITAPQYWWAEFDTYKVGVTRSSTSLMHRSMKKDFTLDDFEIDDLDEGTKAWTTETVHKLNDLRELYLLAIDDNTKIQIFRSIRQILPMSYLYMSTVTMNYENVLTMLHQREHHRLKEWSKDFFNWAHTLPYADEFLFYPC